MITLDIEQGTPEWYEARSAIPTASAFDRLITPTGKASAQADAYYYQLLAEYGGGENDGTDEDSFSSYWMDRGKEIEPEARLAYQLQTGRAVEEVGFVYKDESKMVGCSPDGLMVLEDRGCEIKCPKKRIHEAYFLEGICPKKYVAQVQGSMWVTGYPVWDFVSYHPFYEAFIVEVKRDEVFHAAMDKIIQDFIARLIEGRKSDRVLTLIEARQNQ